MRFRRSAVVLQRSEQRIFPDDVSVDAIGYSKSRRCVTDKRETGKINKVENIIFDDTCSTKVSRDDRAPQRLVFISGNAAARAAIVAVRIRAISDDGAVRCLEGSQKV